MCKQKRLFALQQRRYQPPKTPDATARDAYYGKVADKVVEHTKLSGLDRRRRCRKSRR